jgi:hypothetical protein
MLLVLLRDGWRNETGSDVMPDQKSVDHSKDADNVRVTRFEIPLNSFDAHHISQDKLVASLAHEFALTIGERWHLSGCERCARSLNVLRQLRDARLNPTARR